jgi:hypothetical protein
MNLDLLTNDMGVSPETADAFLNNNAISPTTQTILVAALAPLGNIPGQAELIRQAATSQDEHDAIAFQQSCQLMANLNKSTPVARVTHLNGLTVCQTNDGAAVVPIGVTNRDPYSVTQRRRMRDIRYADRKIGDRIFLNKLVHHLART